MITFGKVKKNEDVFYKHLEGLYFVLTTGYCKHYYVLKCAKNQKERLCDCCYHFFRTEGCCGSLKQHREAWSCYNYQDALGGITIPKKYIKKITIKEWENAPELGRLEALQDTEEAREEFKKWYKKGC